MVAQENRLELSSLCAHTLSSLHMYVGTSCNTTHTAAAVHIYMHGLRSVDWMNNNRNVRTQVFETSNTAAVDQSNIAVIPNTTKYVVVLPINYKPHLDTMSAVFH